MSDWLTVVCVRVCWVKVGYSLLLGHVANPPDPGLDPAHRPLQQQQNTHSSLTVEASRTWLPVSECTGSPEKLSHSGNTQTSSSSNHHPTDLFFLFVCFSLACPQTPSSFVAADERAVLHRLSLKRFEFPFESEWRRSLRCPWRFAFGWPMSCWQKQRRLHLRVTLKMSPWLCSRVKLTRRQLQSVFVPHVSNCIQW